MVENLNLISFSSPSQALLIEHLLHMKLWFCEPWDTVKSAKNYLDTFLGECACMQRPSKKSFFFANMAGLSLLLFLDNA